MNKPRPEPNGSIELITDFSLQSYIVIGRLYRLTLESLGLVVNEWALTDCDGADSSQMFLKGQ